MLGRLRDRYQLISVLGAGGFGQTFLAEDLLQSPPDRCVVKQFKPAKTADQFLEIARRLFDTEVRTLERLGQHPQIPAFRDFFEEAGEFYLVQEFIEGQSLSSEFSARRYTEAEAIALLRDVLEILTFVHSEQVIHRDIKPSNLIRRATDGKIVLIDFGAVKQIGTQLLSEDEQKFTVGIGTQGYTPSEQLAGRPRYCSDLYALGITVVQALTSTQPTQLLAHPETGDPVWQAAISRGLRAILEKMLRYHFSQRYQSATEVLTALDQLAAMPLESTLIPSSLVLSPSLLYHPVGDETLVDRPVAPRPPKLLRQGIRAVALAALSVTGLLLGLRHLGWLQAPELAVYDQLVRLRPQQSADPRLLLVEINEADLQTLQRGTPSDQDVATVIRNLLAHQPRVVGLDLHRDLPQQPGQAQLQQQLQSPKVVTIMKLGNQQTAFDIPPPAGVPESRLGFNDFPIDPDGVVRRNLLYGTAGGQTFTSFGLRLAQKYLEAEQILPRPSPDPQIMQLGKAAFPPLTTTFGGYGQIDAAGYQIMLDYRAAERPGQQVTFTQVLRGDFDPAWVKDRVVLIGTTALSGKDLFYTPFSSGTGDYLMPGVVIHAQIVSQILDAALTRRPLLSAWPTWVEWLWVGGWTVIGGGLAWLVRHPLLLSGAVVVGLGLLVGSTYVLFLSHVWVPSVTPAIGLIVTSAAVMSWRAYRAK
ncbi:MAG: CHASE2 domain-containing protein [Elainella sp.]